MSWQLLTLISVVTFSISVLLRRLLLHKDNSDPLAYVVVYQGLVGIITGIYAVIHGIDFPDFSKYWLAIIATILLYAAANVTSAKVLQEVDASIFSVLYATSAIWTMFAGAFVFSDSITVKQLLGTTLIFLSVGILAGREGFQKINVGIAYGLLMGFLFGLATVGWVYIARHSDIPTWTSISFLGPALVVLLIRPRTFFKLKDFLKGSLLTRMSLLGVVFSVSALTSLFAYRDGNVNVVVVLQQTSIILITILGIVFLNEYDKLWRKLSAAVICFAAVLLIV